MSAESKASYLSLMRLQWQQYLRKRSASQWERMGYPFEGVVTRMGLDHQGRPYISQESSACDANKLYRVYARQEVGEELMVSRIDVFNIPKTEPVSAISLEAKREKKETGWVDTQSISFYLSDQATRSLSEVVGIDLSDNTRRIRNKLKVIIDNSGNMSAKYGVYIVNIKPDEVDLEMDKCHELFRLLGIDIEIDNKNPTTQIKIGDFSISQVRPNASITSSIIWRKIMGQQKGPVFIFPYQVNCPPGYDSSLRSATQSNFFDIVK